jgi:AraC family transcriptional regulator
MKIHATQQFEAGSSILLSSQDRGWESIFVERFQHPSLEGNSRYSNEHATYLALGTQSIYLFKVRDGKTYSKPCCKSDISIAPAKVPSFVRWSGENQSLKIRVPQQFMHQVAGEALAMNDDHLEVLPEARIRDPQIEAIGKLLLTDL